MKFIAASNVLVIDKDLRNAAFAVASSRHRIPARLIPIHRDLRIGHTLAIQQTLGAHAKRAGAPGGDRRLGPRTAAYEGRTLCRTTALIASSSEDSLAPLLDLTDFKRDLSELTDRLGHAQDCL